MLNAAKVKINDIDTITKGIRPKGRIEVPTPEQDIEHIEIRGRHGSLTKKYGYKNITLPVRFYMIDKDSFKSVFRRAKMFLLQAKTIKFDDDDTVFYKVKSVNIDAAENIMKKFGEFVVNFVLEPFQYEFTRPQTITTRITLTNPGYTSAPLITAHVNGTGKIYVNNQVVTLKDVNGTITMDSDMLNAYRIDDEYITNLNNHMIGDFLMLFTGDNVIDFDGDISKVVINPRWRWI